MEFFTGYVTQGVESGGFEQVTNGVEPVVYFSKIHRGAREFCTGYTGGSK